MLVTGLAVKSAVVEASALRTSGSGIPPPAAAQRCGPCWAHCGPTDSLGERRRASRSHRQGYWFDERRRRHMLDADSGRADHLMQDATACV